MYHIAIVHPEEDYFESVASFESYDAADAEFDDWSEKLPHAWLEIVTPDKELSRWGHQPAPPADGEVAELVAWLRETGDTIQPSHLAEHQRYKRAAELLERQVKWHKEA